MKGHTKKVTSIAINPDAQQVGFSFVLPVCILMLLDAKLTSCADIHRLSRQDFANMAYGEWPSKHLACISGTELPLVHTNA